MLSPLSDLCSAFATDSDADDQPYQDILALQTIGLVRYLEGKFTHLLLY